MNGFTVAARSRPAAAHRDRFELRSHSSVFRDRDGFEILLPQYVIEGLHAFGRRAAPHEFLGLVYGQMYEDALGRFAVVCGVVPIDGASATEVSVSSTPSSAARAEALAERLYPEAHRLGWAHSHPRLGTRYSITDEQNQATYSSQDVVGIVVDPWCPVDGGLGVYRGPRSSRLACEATPRTNTDAARAPATVDCGATVDVKPGFREFRWALAAALAGYALLLASSAVTSRRLATEKQRIDRIERELHAVQIPAGRARALNPALLKDGGVDASL